LMDGGMAAPDAVAAVRPYSPYGSLLHNTPVAGRLASPGIFFLAQTPEGRWVGFDGPDVKVSIQVRMWAIFDEVFPRFCEVVRPYAKAVPAEQMDMVISEYAAAMNKLREQRHRSSSYID